MAQSAFVCIVQETSSTKSQLQHTLREIGDTEMVLNEKQQEALTNSMLGNVCVITGGPGVGKTFTAKSVIDALKAKGHRIVLACPTGKAAKRLSEVTTYPAKTIHRLLEPQIKRANDVDEEDNKLADADDNVVA